MRKLSAATALIALIASVSACSVSTGDDPKLTQGDVEEKAAEQLEAQSGDDVTVECPDDLDGEVGATMTCTFEDSAGVEGELALEVTEVDGSTIDFDIEVTEG